MSEPLTHAELGDITTRLQLGIDASELHGLLTGYLCAGGQAGAEAWPEALQLDPVGDGWQGDGFIQRLYRMCREQLEDEQLGFEPLLPDEDRPLVQRGDALVEWCRGFLGGVGLVGADDARALTDNAGEVLRDLGTIASSRFEYDNDEGDEDALVEVLEFVRIGVLLLHAELGSRPRTTLSAPSSERLH